MPALPGLLESPALKIEVPKPLFERLVDLEPGGKAEPTRLQNLDRQGLLESIRSELERLFNTRAPLTIDHLRKRQRTVIDYGIPDPLSFSAENPDHHLEMARLLESTITAYEPRLEEISVRVEHGALPGSIAILVTAVLRIDQVKEPINFPILLEHRKATASLEL